MAERRRHARFAPRKPLGDEARDEEPTRGALDVALDATHLPRKVDPGIALELEGLVEERRRIEERISVHGAVAQELGLLEAGNRAEDPRLLAPGHARLETDDLTPPQTDEFRAQVRWCKPKSPEIVMGRQLQAFHASTHVPAVSLIQKIIDTRMHGAGGRKNSLRFRFAVRLPNILHM